MPMNPKVVMVACLTFAAVLTLVVLHYSRPIPREAHIVIVYDRSLSPRDGCDSIKTLADRAIVLTEGRRAMCSIKIFATGEKATAYEPVTVGVPPLPKRTGRVLDGKNRFLEEKGRFLNDTYTRCGELGRTDQSPIFLSIKRAVEHLKALDSKGSDLYLFVKTDLEENIDPDIRNAIRESPGKRSKLPTPIDNSGITISFCGYSDTSSEYTDARGRTRQATPLRSAKSADRLLEVWRSLFSHPELVTFTPICSDK